jgi:hypothetical protein
MPETEADTCRKYVLPKLYGAGWTDDQINEQHTFTDGLGTGWSDSTSLLLASVTK